MLSAHPLSSTEFLAVDVETNGLPSEGCELTEIGAVLVGGGELHERFESLVRVQQPLGRGIQRFTGITQAMSEGAPTPDEVLPRLAAMMERRVLVAHSASFDSRVLKQAFDRAGLTWPDPPVLCTVAMARRFAPLARQRKLGALAGALGIDVEQAHRALADAETCARVFCALFPRLCAHAVSVADAVAVLGPGRRSGGRRGSSRRGGAGEGAGGVRGGGAAERGGGVRGGGAGERERATKRRRRDERPDLRALPDDPGVYIFRDVRGRPLYIGKSVSVRTRARSHFCTPAGWTERAEVVDYRPTHSELGALVLENRLIKEHRPPGNVRLKHTDGHVYLIAKLDIPYPVLEVGSEPAAGRAVNIGPVRGARAAQDLAEELSSVFGLRHCGRALPRRDHPSVYGQMGRCVSPCLGDLDPNAYRRRLDEALALFEGSADGRERLLQHIEEQMREASALERYERAAALRGRLERLGALLERLGGVLKAVHARSRLILAPHPSKDAFDALWVVAGRVVDWGPLPERAELLARTERVLASAVQRQRHRVVAADEVDEIRIVSAYLAAHDLPEIPLDPVPDALALEAALHVAQAA